MKEVRKIANQTNIGTLVIDLTAKTEALEKGLETAKKKLQEIEQNNKQLENSNKSLDASFVAMSASIILVLTNINSAIKDCVNEYNSYTQAMSGLQNISNYTGQDINKLTEIMQKFTKYGLTQSDIATAIKNFTLMGYTVEETEQMIMALTESAISNRQACYSVSEAVRMASEGYKNGISTLSDAAGVTENLSVMESKYAESIGKTASQLTEAEKNQAYLNRTMEAAAPFAGATAQYMESLAGKQGEYSQALRETQVAYAEAMEPMLIKFEEFKTKVVSGLGEIMSKNESATVGITTFVVTLGTMSLAMSAIKKACSIYKSAITSATTATKGFTAVLAANPIGATVLAVSSLVGIFTAATTAIKEKSEAQRKLNEITERYNQIQEGTYGFSEQEISTAEKDKQAIEEQIGLLEEKAKLEEKIREASNSSAGGKVGSIIEVLKDGSIVDLVEDFKAAGETSEEAEKNIESLNNRLYELNEQIKESRKTNGNYGDTLEELNNRLNRNKEYLEDANAIQNMSNALDVESVKTQQKEAAQLKINANQMQDYLDIVKKGDTSTSEYKDAVNQLAKAYPDAANAEGIMIDQAQGLIDSAKLTADAKWKESQDVINANIAMLNAALQNESVQRQVAQNIGISYEELLPKLQNVLGVLQVMAGYQPTDVPNITPTTVSTPKRSSSSASSYSNKRLDNYKKEIEHKKALDQISLQQEISMYEYALRYYAKTSDERMELREKIYDLNKELAQKEKELLDQQTEDYENYIQDQINNRGAEYDIQDRTKDYDKIISMHRNYLNQIMLDERLSLEERKEIYREELQTIRDYEQQKRDLRVEAVDNTVSQLTDAITKQLEEMQEKDTEYINKQIEEIEKLKDLRIDAINAEYEAKIDAIEKELEALDKSEQQKSRDEEDAEYEAKKKRLEDLIAFEHDVTTKANYQKELDKLLKEYQEKLDERALEDKKEALNAEKELLQEEQDNKIQAIEDEAEKQEEIYNKQLEELEKYYSEQIEQAQKTAEKMLLNVEQNQNEILNLLKNYGDAYEITGQTLGEKLAQGINNGVANKIQNIIQNIQDAIDKGIENQISSWSKELYKYEAEANKPQATTKSINITQNNYIEQNPELASETYRKLRNIDEELAAQLV